MLGLHICCMLQESRQCNAMHSARRCFWWRDITYTLYPNWSFLLGEWHPCCKGTVELFLLCNTVLYAMAMCLCVYVFFFLTSTETLVVRYSRTSQSSAKMVERIEQIFGTEASYPTLCCKEIWATPKIGYFSWNFVPNSGLRKFCHGKLMVARCCQ